MAYSVYSSHRRINQNLQAHDDIDKVSNQIVSLAFVIMILLQVVNALLWQAIARLLAALIVNLAGAALQFTRLIRSAFHD